MKKDHTDRQEPMLPAYTHAMPKQLADYLRQKDVERLSKFDAFHDLMQRQARLLVEPSEANASTIVVTLTQLAGDWGWHRHSVSRFLDHLSDLGVLSYQQVGHSSRLCLPGLEILAS